MLNLKILFFSSPFDTDNADFLENLGVKLYKIASMDLNNLPLIEHVAKKLPIILSTGMSRLHEIDEAVETIKNSGNENLSILHCNSAYPSSHDEINLNFMKKLKTYTIFQLDILIILLVYCHQLLPFLMVLKLLKDILR